MWLCFFFVVAIWHLFYASCVFSVCTLFSVSAFNNIFFFDLFEKVKCTYKEDAKLNC